MRSHFVWTLGILSASVTAIGCAAADPAKTRQDGSTAPDGASAGSAPPNGGGTAGAAPEGTGDERGDKSGAGGASAAESTAGTGGSGSALGGGGEDAGRSESAGGSQNAGGSKDPGRAGGAAGLIGGQGGNRFVFDGGNAAAGGSAGRGGGTGRGGSTGKGGSGAIEDGGSDPFAQARQDCVDGINGLRAQVSLPALSRWTSNESCADGQAKSDAQSNDYHGAFSACPNNAQNECPDYPSVASIVNTTDTRRGCLAMMWAEGPGTGDAHGHYTNITNKSFTQVSCGFYTTTSGTVWSVQDFK